MFAAFCAVDARSKVPHQATDKHWLALQDCLGLREAKSATKSPTPCGLDCLQKPTAGAVRRKAANLGAEPMNSAVMASGPEELQRRRVPYHGGWRHCVKRLSGRVSDWIPKAASCHRLSAQSYVVVLTVFKCDVVGSSSKNENDDQLEHGSSCTAWPNSSFACLGFGRGSRIVCLCGLVNRAVTAAEAISSGNLF